MKKIGLPSSQYIKFCATIDDRGRIFIPADIRKTLALNTGDLLDLMLSNFKKSFEVRKIEPDRRQRRQFVDGDEK